MKADGFDAITRVLGERSSRRAAVVAGALVVAGLLPRRAGRPGAAQDRATPAASPGATPVGTPVATPGLLDIVAGSPPAAGGGSLARFPECCQEFRCVAASGEVVEVFDLRDNPCPGQYSVDRAQARCDANPACGRRGCVLVCSDGREEEKEDLPTFTPA